MRSLYIYLFLFIAQGLFAQHTFQRTYEISDRLTIHGGMSVSHDGGFYMLNVYPDIAEGVLKFHVTRHHLKGDVLWAYDYELEGYGNNIDFDMDIMELDDKGVMFVATQLTAEGSTNVDLMVKIDSEGLHEWSQIADSDPADATVISGQATLRKNFNQGVVLATLNSDDTELLTNSQMTSIDAEGVLEWSKLYRILDEDGVGDFSLVLNMDRSIADSTYVMAGIADSTLTNEIFITKVDKDGELLWSRSYLQSQGEGLNTQVLDISCGLDTTTTITGILQDPVNGIIQSYVMKVDKDGIPLWTNTIDMPGGFPLTFSTQVLSDIGNNVIIAGRSIDILTGELNDYMARLNSLGDLVWSKRFPRIDSYVLDQNLGLLIGGDLRQNGTEYMLSGIASNINVGNLYPFVVRVDPAGSAVCEEEALLIVNDTLLSFTHDTLFWSSEDFGVFEDFEVVQDTFMDYDLPMVTLLDTFFCPQDPIMVTLDATAQYAQTYAWSTGEDTPTIDVTEDGEYMVTVTFDTLACFTLCDTSIITKLEFPELSIIGDNSDYCETQDYGLIGNPSMGLPPFTFVWSTGEQESNIRVTEFGDYGLTVTDACGNTAMNTISYNEASLPNIDPFPGLTFNQSLFCDTGVYQIGLFNNAGMTDIVWSTGETDVDAIDVPGPGVYSVSGIVCFQEITLNLNEDDFGGDPLSSTIMFDESVYCSTQSYPITVDPSGGFTPYTYIWSTGDEVPMITVSDPGTYDVTISDSCNDQLVQSITIDESSLPDPIEPLLSFDVDTFCANGDLIITLDNANAGFVNGSWSNGVANAPFIQVDEVGVYTFEAQQCFQDVSATIDVGAEISSEQIEFPNVFIPRQENSINQTFGPYVECPFLIDDYELKVFNRWGKEMFMSTSVTSRWNGVFDGKLQPSQVFFWYARYTEPGGNEVILEGDVTLLK